MRWENVFEEWGICAIFFRLLAAMLIGLCIGLERGMKNRAAGIKTHVLVCVASALVMLTGQYIQVQFPDAGTDIARLGAQVISGVGFLGVGTIIVTGKNQVRGLTTAAGLWTSACCGLAVGIGFVDGAFIALLFILFTLKILNRLDLQIHRHAKTFDMYIEFENNKAIHMFTEEMHNQNIKISEFELSKGFKKGEGPVAIVGVDIGKTKERTAVIDSIREFEYIRYVEDL